VLVNVPRRQRPRLVVALTTTAAYLALSGAAYLVAAALAAGSVDANIGAGLIGIGPALPWVLFTGGSGDHVALFVCYAVNALIAGGVAFLRTTRREN
jgi:hypothetical protein